MDRRTERKAISKRVAQGGARIVAGGGDGTLNSVTNAILRNGDDESVSKGLVH